MHICSLCLSPTEYFVTWQTRTYFHCSICRLTQLRPVHHPSRMEEKEEYLLHNNDSSDEGYRRFLNRVTAPVLLWLNDTYDSVSRPKLLDFGCGSGPTISVVLGEQGWRMDNYDPIFFSDTHLLEQLYDLVVCTEVVEHFFRPKATWKDMISLLNEGGRLVVMTQVSDQYQQPLNFTGWHYIRELSHVSFYHTDTMRWIANEYGLHLTIWDKNVFCFDRV